MRWSHLLLISAIIGAGVLSGFSSRIDDYVVNVIVLIGINIILATSLNLVNGHTGQFSLGHAGFMAIGAYSSAYFTVTFGDRIRAALAMLPPFARDGGVLLIALTIGAILAAIAGFLVGVPSLRLRGDYLAIVTLGFGEIIRVFILNIDAVGGARGYSGIPKIANFFWIYLFAAFTISRKPARSRRRFTCACASLAAAAAASSTSSTSIRRSAKSSTRSSTSTASRSSLTSAA